MANRTREHAKKDPRRGSLKSPRCRGGGRSGHRSLADAGLRVLDLINFVPTLRAIEHRVLMAGEVGSGASSLAKYRRGSEREPRWRSRLREHDDENSSGSGWRARVLRPKGGQAVPPSSSLWRNETVPEFSSSASGKASSASVTQKINQLIGNEIPVLYFHGVLMG